MIQGVHDQQTVSVVVMLGVLVLQALLPHVWWPGCKDETASEERLKASVSVITATLSKVEQCQYELMQLLLATPFQQHTSSSSSSSGEQDADCALLVFLRFLLQKNRAALRDVPPPGLSEPTVIMSTFFGLLRLLQPALHAAQEQGCGPLAAFPAAELLAGSDASAEAQPVYDVPRLGGTISHLAREHPTSDLEKQPVHVVPQQQQPSPGSSWDAAGPALRDAWVPELLNSCMLLYAWRVGFSYKMIHSLSSSVASSSATVDELDRMIAAGTDTADASQVRCCNAVLLLCCKLAGVLLFAFRSPCVACCAGATVCLLDCHCMVTRPRLMADTACVALGLLVAPLPAACSPHRGCWVRARCIERS
jgi:hypothetical protein